MRRQRMRVGRSTRIARSRRFALAALAALVLTAGAAYAYFTASGAGAGAANANTLQAVTVSAVVGGDAPASTLSPGGPAADVILRVNNPNSFSVRLYSLAGNGAVTVDVSHSSCTTPGVTFTPPSSPNVTLPSGSSLVHLAGAATMSTASLSACQGATFTIPVTVTVRT
ncbi:MAG: hypothetical protein QOE35_2020 [Actinomycetota bacterium]